MWRPCRGPAGYPRLIKNSEVAGSGSRSICACNCRLTILPHSGLGEGPPADASRPRRSRLPGGASGSSHHPRADLHSPGGAQRRWRSRGFEPHPPRSPQRCRPGMRGPRRSPQCHNGAGHVVVWHGPRLRASPGHVGGAPSLGAVFWLGSGRLLGRLSAGPRGGPCSRPRLPRLTATPDARAS